MNENTCAFRKFRANLESFADMSKSNVRAQSEQLFNLQVQGDKYARLLIEQKHRLRQLDDHWKKVHEELKELRLKRGESDQRGGGVNAVRTRMADEQRELMKLENRLSACRTRESKMIAYNAELRGRVDELRANRVLSQTVFEKNQRRLRDVQKQMQETFRQSTQIVAERDRILSQANSLSGQNIDEQEAFDQVYQSLASIIKREKESAEAYRKQILEQDPMDLADDFVRGNMKLEDEQQLKKTLQKLDMTMLEDKQNIASISEKLQEFETTFAGLQQEMGVDDYHELVDVYCRKEEENFALFRYVQSTNNEVEQLEDEKLALEREIQKLKIDMQDGSANARKRMVDDLVETRQKILKENAEIERLRAAAAREFQPLARVVDRLYNALGCNDVMPPVIGATTTSSGGGPDNSKRTRKQSEDQLAMVARINSMNDLLAAHGITEGNILQFLAIIEQRSNDLIEQFSRRLQFKNPAEAQRASLGANLRPSDPTRSVNAIRALLPDFLDGPATGNGYGGVSSPLATSPISLAASCSFGGAGIDFNVDRQASRTSVVSNSIAEDEPESPRSDDEDGDRPLTRIELQKRAAKSFANLQVSPKLQPIRAKPVLPKKKKH
ncbi:Outer dynein arm protein 1 [Phytophthora citrophthora]|uniref:Outer dynein arm protein 1 n=1 Tax=Phytophthora citrophthora TaxID=4793 RepID=A0AAD9GVX9_9STRA|nr:Outer dynein arm protein 1 [Phytophthora citrophthora]